MPSACDSSLHGPARPATPPTPAPAPAFTDARVTVNTLGCSTWRAPTAPAQAPCAPTPQLLHLFASEPSELQDMLSAVQRGDTWRKVIKVPARGVRFTPQPPQPLTTAPSPSSAASSDSFPRASSSEDGQRHCKVRHSTLVCRSPSAAQTLLDMLLGTPAPAPQASAAAERQPSQALHSFAAMSLDGILSARQQQSGRHQQQQPPKAAQVPPSPMFSSHVIQKLCEEPHQSLFADQALSTSPCLPVAIDDFIYDSGRPLALSGAISTDTLSRLAAANNSYTKPLCTPMSALTPSPSTSAMRALASPCYSGPGPEHSSLSFFRHSRSSRQLSRVTGERGDSGFALQAALPCAKGRSPSGPAMRLVDLPEALATSGWRHARVRTLNANIHSRDSSTPSGSVSLAGTPRVAALFSQMESHGLSQQNSTVRDTTSLSGRSQRAPGAQIALPSLHSHANAASGAHGNGFGSLCSAPANVQPPHTFTSHTLPEQEQELQAWQSLVANVHDFCGTPAELESARTSRSSPNSPKAVLDAFSSRGSGRRHAYHDLCAMPFHDPMLKTTQLLLMQMDVTMRVEAEMRLAEVTDSQFRMLEGMFPKHVLWHMLQDNKIGQKGHSKSLQQLARKHQGVTVFFMDVCGFTDMAKQVEPHVVLSLLSRLFQRIDALVDSYSSLFKIETADDAYLAASNLLCRDEHGCQVFSQSPQNVSADKLMRSNWPSEAGSALLNTASSLDAGSCSECDLQLHPSNTDSSHNEEPEGQQGNAQEALWPIRASDASPAQRTSSGAQQVPSKRKGPSRDMAADGAIAMFCFAHDVLLESAKVLMPHSKQPVQVRVGLHTGEVVSGMVGTKLPKFGLFGDTMNCAARMEQTGKPGCIQMTAATRALLPVHLVIPSTGGVKVKGKGMMDTYLYNLADDTIPDSWFAEQQP